VVIFRRVRVSCREASKIPSSSLFDGKASLLASLKIPERYRQGVLLLAKMPDEAFSELLAALKKAPEHMTTIRELSVWVGPEAAHTPKSDVAKILDALTSLHRLQKRVGFPVLTIARDVADDVQEYDQDSRDRLRGRLEVALPFETLNVASAKARELQTDRDKIFCDAKILTDIRPIFGESIGESPEAAIIVHTIKLGFHDSGSASHKEIYIALDANDISTLKKILERAEQKEKALISVLRSASVKQIEL
jgi:hypothetical protein